MIEMLSLSDSKFSVEIDEKNGCIKRLAGAQPGYSQVEFCDSRPLKPEVSSFWGEVIIRDESCEYRATSGQTTTVKEDDELDALYEFDDFNVRVKRRIFTDYFDENYELLSKNTFSLTSFGIVFRPAMGMLVGEHEAYRLIDYTPTVYHWFTGNNLAYLCITHTNGNPPHLAIVLIDGCISGMSMPYVYQWSLIDPLPCFPILHVTGLALHKEDDEYSQPHIKMRKGDSKKVTLRYFLFYDWSDFEKKMVELCTQPVFTYPHCVPVGSRLEVLVTLPKNLSELKATLNGKELELRHIDGDRYLFSTIVQNSGLQKINFEYGKKENLFSF